MAGRQPPAVGGCTGSGTSPQRHGGRAGRTSRRLRPRRPHGAPREQLRRRYRLLNPTARSRARAGPLRLREGGHWPGISSRQPAAALHLRRRRGVAQATPPGASASSKPGRGSRDSRVVAVRGHAQDREPGSFSILTDPLMVRISKRAFPSPSRPSRRLPPACPRTVNGKSDVMLPLIVRASNSPLASWGSVTATEPLVVEKEWDSSATAWKDARIPPLTVEASTLPDESNTETLPLTVEARTDPFIP